MQWKTFVKRFPVLLFQAERRERLLVLFPKAGIGIDNPFCSRSINMRKKTTA